MAVENDLFVICDEVYREFVFDGGSVRSFTEFEELDQRIIVVDSVSKRFNACGVRIGCMATHNREILDVALRFCQARLSVATAEQLIEQHFRPDDPEFVADPYGGRNSVVVVE